MKAQVRIVALGVAVGAAVGALGAHVTDALGTDTAGKPVVLRVGEQMRVRTQPVGCLVRRFEGRPGVDCRRAGPLAGTYGTLLDRTKVVVVRFESRNTGKAVFTAHHGRRSFSVCRD